jgi:ribonuclease BN (tRNA processing enzyme)
MTKKPEIDLVSLGTGNGTSYAYGARPSSSFAIRIDEEPVLLVDIGVGVAMAAIKYLEGGIPDNIYISHNHLDHSGDLPIVLAVESAQGRRLRILGHPDVLKRIISHRVHELYSTGKSYSDFAEWVRADSTGEIHVSPELTLYLVKSQHSELCYGFLMRFCGEPILGFTRNLSKLEWLLGTHVGKETRNTQGLAILEVSLRIITT